MSNPNTAQMPPQAQEAQPPRRLPQKKKPAVPELVVEMREWFTALERSVAGYNGLQQSLLSFQGQIPEGERKKGLPVFKFPASVDGRNAIEVVADLKHVDPQYVPHVLIPLINAQGVHMLEAVEEIEERIGMVKAALASLVQQQPQKQSEQDDPD